MLSFTIGRSTISVFLDGTFFSVDDSHANYQPLYDQLNLPAPERDLQAISELVTIKRMIERLTSGRITVSDTEVLFEGTLIGNYMAGRMIEIMNEGFDIEPYAKFMDKVMSNPAVYIRDELYQWMEKAKMPITPDGNFIAFKKVRADYTDCHTGKFDNSPGVVVAMDRAGCDTNRHNHCSSGFHFCSPGYLSSFGGQRVVAVEINPADVTSIPSDYKFTKGRTCQYTVVAELKSESQAYHEAWRKGVVDLENPAEFPSSVLTKITLPAAVVNEPVQAASDPVDNTPGIDAPAEVVYRSGDLVEVVQKGIYDGVTGTVDYCATSDTDGLVWIKPVTGHALSFNPSDLKLLKAAPEPFLSSIPGTIVTRVVDDAGTKLVVSTDITDLSPSAQLDVANIAVMEAEKAHHAKAIVTIAPADVSDINAQFAGMRADRDRKEAKKAKKKKAAKKPNQKTVKKVDAPLTFMTSNSRLFTEAQIVAARAESSSVRGTARILDIGDSTLRGWLKQIEARV